MNELAERPDLTFKMYGLISDFWVACAVYTTANLGIADLLSEGPKTLHELAEMSDSHEESLYRLLRVVTSVGIFEEKEQKIFVLNDYGKILVSDVPGSMRCMFLTMVGKFFPVLGNLTYGVKTGKVPFDDVFNMPIWEYLKEHPDTGLDLMKAMSGVSSAVIKAILDAYDFTPYSNIVDVGGGNGTLLTRILSVHTHCQGIVFDEPYVAENAEKQIPQELKSRCTTVGGSFFDKLPAGADLYILKWIIHDWNNESSIEILKVCHEAMRVGSKLLIMDVVISDELNKPDIGKPIDLNIMALCTGRERTLQEVKVLAGKANLSFTRFIPTNGNIIGIIEFEKTV